MLRYRVSGLLDELFKIAAVNLAGLSPQTIIENGIPPDPMETVGFTKARDILGRAEQMKTAGIEPKRGMVKLQEMVKRSAITPGMQLKSSQQVGSKRKGLATSAAPGIKTQVGGSAIGRKFLPKG